MLPFVASVACEERTKDRSLLLSKETSINRGSYVCKAYSVGVAARQTACLAIISII